MSRSKQAFEAAMFKRVADGFVFRAPSRWLFGRGRYLLVNESQKVEIVERMAGSGRWRLLLAFLLWIAGYGGAIAGLALLTGHDDPTPGDNVVIAVLGVASLLVCLQAWYVLSLRPLIAGLPESVERFDYRERHRALRKAMLLHSWLLAGAFWSVACVLNLQGFFLKTHGARHFSFSDGAAFTPLALAMICGLLAAWFFYLEIRAAKPAAGEEVETGSQPAMDRLLLRLDRVEEDNRRLRRTLAGVVALGAVLALAAVLFAGLMPRAVETDRVILRDSKGEIAALLAVGKNDMPTLGLYGPERKLRMLMGLADIGSPSLGLYGPDGKLRKTVGIGRDEGGPVDMGRILASFPPSEAPPRDVVENYLSAPAAKAWVVSAAAHSRTITTGAPTIEEAKKRALEACGKQPGADDCTVVMIDNDWVGPASPGKVDSPR